VQLALVSLGGLVMRAATRLGISSRNGALRPVTARSVREADEYFIFGAYFERMRVCVHFVQTSVSGLNNGCLRGLQQTHRKLSLTYTKT
jgi:hypothetical protein